MLKDIIKSITKQHLLKNNSLLFAQCVQAVGWIGNTVPDDVGDKIVELPTSDVMNSGVVTGVALMGKRPIYIVRYQGFNWYNAAMIVNYAAKSKQIWNKPCPIFIRSISMENGIGPVAGSSHASLFYRMPGIKIYSPMNGKEYHKVYESFMKDDCPYYISEHRGSWNLNEDLPDITNNNPDFVLFPISITRFEAVKAQTILEKMGYKISIIHQFDLNGINQDSINELKNSKYGGLVFDDDYENGIGKCIASDLMLHTQKKVYTMGLENKTAGFHKQVDNLPPNCEKIVEFVIRNLN